MSTPAASTRTSSPTSTGRVVAESWVRSMLPRLMTVLGPLIIGVTVAILAWAQDAIGIDLQHHAATIATFVGTLILGGLGLLATWVFNAGQGQIELAARALDRVVDEGRALETGTTPSATGGVSNVHSTPPPRTPGV